MTTLECRYLRTDPKKMKRQEKIQLISTAFVLLISALDTLENPDTLDYIITLINWGVAAIFIRTFLRYDRMKLSHGSRFETQLFRITGLVFLANGITGHLSGGHRIPYFYYAMALVYFFGLSRFVSKAKSKYTIRLEETGITLDHAFKKMRAIPWSNIQAIEIQDNRVSIFEKHRKRPQNYYLDELDERRHEVLASINTFQK